MGIYGVLKLISYKTLFDKVMMVLKWAGFEIIRGNHYTLITLVLWMTLKNYTSHENKLKSFPQPIAIDHAS